MEPWAADAGPFFPCGLDNGIFFPSGDDWEALDQYPQGYPAIPFDSSFDASKTVLHAGHDLRLTSSPRFVKKPPNIAESISPRPDKASMRRPRDLQTGVPLLIPDVLASVGPSPLPHGSIDSDSPGGATSVYTPPSTNFGSQDGYEMDAPGSSYRSASVDHDRSSPVVGATLESMPVAMRHPFASHAPPPQLSPSGPHHAESRVVSAPWYPMVPHGYPLVAQQGPVPQIDAGSNIPNPDYSVNYAIGPAVDEAVVGVGSRFDNGAYFPSSQYPSAIAVSPVSTSHTYDGSPGHMLTGYQWVPPSSHLQFPFPPGTNEEIRFTPSFYPPPLPDTQPMWGERAPGIPLSSSSERRAKARTQPYQPPRPEIHQQPGNATSIGPIRPTKGGRPKDSHLEEEKRDRSAKMRKKGACWRCALQRDSCDHGDPCERCTTNASRLQKGYVHDFGCSRVKLPQLLGDLQPPSLTTQHSKQFLEDCVSRDVGGWYHASTIEASLSSGYGPPLRWKLYEFHPHGPELTMQVQCTQNSKTGQAVHYMKYSPPFGLLRIDQTDEAYFNSHLETLLKAEHLHEFGLRCYAEENLVDDGHFQAKLLDSMCTLYLDTEDETLKKRVREVLRMIMLEYIMGHTLVFEEESLPHVLQSINYSRRPSVPLERWTSPRLANRQFKYFFRVLLEDTIISVLKKQQATLHDTNKKDGSWLHAFCTVLGLAMVLEEVQRTIQMQADVKHQREGIDWAYAQHEAYNACLRIDECFKLMMGLFQLKYRDKTWGERGSFGPGTPVFRDPASHLFATNVRQLVARQEAHLRSRAEVPLGHEHQCRYTTRLTAMFLLPFLGLPG